MSCLVSCCFLSLFLLASLEAMSILHVDEQEVYNTDFLYNLTIKLIRMRRYDSFVTYCDNRQEIRLERLLTGDIGLPVVVWGHDSKGRLREMMSEKNMVFVSIESVNDTILDVIDETLRGLHWLPILFIYKRHDKSIPTEAELKAFFAKCWYANLINIAVTYQVRSGGKIQNLLYGYTPFPKLTIKNLTTVSNTPEKVFSYDMPIGNVNGYKFEVPVFQNPPSVILHQEKLTPTLAGFVGNSFRTYVKCINGTMAIRFKPNDTIYTYHERLLLEAANKRIDIGVHPFTRMQPIANQTEKSFPISTTNSCVIVPFVSEIPVSEYIFRSRLSHLWFTMPSLWVMLLVLGYLSGKSWRFSLSLHHTNCLLFTQPLPNEAFQQQRVPYKFFYLSVLLCVLIFINMNNATLSSALSTRIIGRQISTVEDFLASDLKILAVEMQRQSYFETDLLPKELIDRIELTDMNTLLSHMKELNTSYAYIVQGHFWEFLSQRQRRLRQPLFRIAGKDLCSMPHFMYLPLQWDSLFYTSMYGYFLRTQEMGLEQRWRSSSSEESIRMGMLTILEDDIMNLRPLSLKFYSLAMKLYLGMILLCVICFVFEHCLKYYQKHVQAQSKN